MTVLDRLLPSRRRYPWATSRFECPGSLVVDPFTGVPGPALPGGPERHLCGHSHTLVWQAGQTSQVVRCGNSLCGWTGSLIRGRGE